MSWQDSHQFEHFDLNHEFLEVPVQDFDYFGSYSSNFSAWNPDSFDVSLDQSGATVLSTNEWTQFDDAQVITYAQEATEEILPLIEGQTVISEPSSEEKELRELRQQVSQLKESLVTLQHT